MKFIKEEIYNALQYQHSNGVSITKAAKQYYISRHTLAAYQNFDFSECIYIPNEHRYVCFTEQERDALAAYQSGAIATVTQIREQFGLHHEKFAQMCQYAGIPVIRHDTQYTFNRNALSTLETESDAYILGFLPAEAYVCEERTSVRIKLHNRDQDILHKINQALKSNIPIHFEKHNVTANTLCRLELASITFVQNLKQYGLHQAKSLKEIFYQDIPEHLMRHYIRGLIDGDGYISKNTCHVGICGSQDIVQNVAKHLQQVAGVPPEKQRNARQEKDTSLYRFELCGENARAAMRWLYAGSNIHLDRKYNLAKQYINLL